jgi:hypothetical protein
MTLSLLYLSSNELHDPSQSINEQSCTTNAKSKENMIFLTDLIRQILNKTNEKKIFLCYRSLYELVKSTKTSHDQLDICLYDHNTIEFDLNEIKKKYDEFNFEYNRWLGFYRLQYFEASAFIYEFVLVKSSQREFETIRRSGLFYTQFNYLNLNLSSSQLLPVYMVEEMSLKVNIFNNLFFVPLDAYEVLMRLYPSLWSLPNFDCSI